MAWDGDWYQSLLVHGYDGVSVEGVRFFPGFVLVGRLADAILPGGPGVALVSLANVSALVAAVLLHRLVLLETGNRAVARRAVWALSLFPPAFVLVWAYGEGLFLALAKEVPNPNGKEELVANPYKTWKEVNPALPNVKIEVVGPPPTSGTRDSFNELGIEGGCKTFPWLKAMKSEDKSKYKSVCRSIREDGAYVEAGENDNLIVQKLESNPNAVGVFGYSFLEENTSIVKPVTIGGVAPGPETVSSGEYPMSRSMFFYVKKAHVGVVPGIEGYVKEFTSERAWGNDGYLVENGLIPSADSEREKWGKQAKNLKPMTGKEFK
jgi:hypothetical protein